MRAVEKQTMADDRIAAPRPQWKPSGKRRDAEPSLRARKLEWPSASKERRELLNLWFYYAPQIAGLKAAPVLLAFRHLIVAKSGTTWASNETIAQWAGQVSLAHVKRLISLIIDRGLLVSELGWRQGEDGRWRKSRTLYLALPDPFPKEVRGLRRWEEIEPQDIKEGLTRGAHESEKSRPAQGDNRLHVDSKEGLTRGAITLKGLASASSEMNRHGGDVPPASDAGDSPDHDRHDATARLKRASALSPSSSVEHGSEKSDAPA
jgi:hypothetical protein